MSAFCCWNSYLIGTFQRQYLQADEKSRKERQEREREKKKIKWVLTMLGKSHVEWYLRKVIVVLQKCQMNLPWGISNPRLQWKTFWPGFKHIRDCFGSLEEYHANVVETCAYVRKEWSGTFPDTPHFYFRATHGLNHCQHVVCHW